MGKELTLGESGEQRNQSDCSPLCDDVSIVLQLSPKGIYTSIPQNNKFQE